MKPLEHLKSYCRFWKPSVSRRITFYFLIFGLAVFLITSMLYTGATRKHFLHSTSRLINHQFSLMAAAQMPDFLWKGIGKPNPELERLFQILTNLSSSFYTVSDISIYAKAEDETLWYRLFFDPQNVMRLNPAKSSFSQKLDRNLERHFAKSGLLARSAGEHALFVNVTGKDDLNTYFLKIGIDIEFELEKGREIQREFLPSQIPILPNWEIASCFYPAGQVSGDFYDVFMLPDGNVGLVIADVCDKGVGSALYMALFRSLIRVFAEQAIHCSGPDLTQISAVPGNIEAISSSANNPMARLAAVASTNNYIAHIHGRECMYATLFFGVLNPASGILFYINGGHEPLYIINAGSIKDRLKPTGPEVGLMPDITYRVQEIRLEPGDLLVGYTDGVTEARFPQGEIYTRDRLQALLIQPFKSASETLERIKTNLFTFIDIAPRGDDVTMLAVQRALL